MTSFIEKPNIRAVHWLKQHLNCELWAKHYMEDEDINKKQKLEMTVKYLDTLIKNNCVLRVDYFNADTDTHNIGRQYGHGVQGIPSAFRGLLFGDNTTDIDMVNAHPSILRHLCQSKNIPCPYLDKYCDDRAELIANKEATKIEILRCMFKSDELKTRSSFLRFFDKEMKMIQEEFWNDIEFKMIRDGISPKRPNKIGTFMAYVLQSKERMILGHTFQFVTKKGNEICANMFDGLLVYGKFDLCDELNDYIHTETGFPIKFITKPHNSSIEVPEDYVYESDEQVYGSLKRYYEDECKLAFIHSTGEYCYEKDGVLLLKRRDDMKNSLAPITFIKKDKEVSFFDTWNKDKTRKEYNDVGMISPDMKPNPNILNLWKPFYCQTLKFDTVISIQPILDYFMVMANGDKDVYDYFLKYIKNMLLFPSKPQQAICLASIEQGNGKSTFFKFLEALVGRERCFETKSISTDVCGTFNGHFEHMVLTHLEDIEPEDYRKNEAELRSIINKQYMPIHHKGKKSVEKKNFNHLIMTTNYLHTVRYTDEQRRIMGVECGTDYLGDYDKFKELYRIIENDHFLYSFYKFLLDEIECPEILTKEDMPISSLMKEGCEMNVDNIVSFVSDLEDGKYTTLSLYAMFKTFTQERGYQDKRTYNTFSKDLKRQVEKTNAGIHSKHMKNEDGKEQSGYIIERR